MDSVADYQISLEIKQSTSVWRAKVDWQCLKRWRGCDMADRGCFRQCGAQWWGGGIRPCWIKKARAGCWCGCVLSCDDGLIIAKIRKNPVWERWRRGGREPLVNERGGGSINRWVIVKIGKNSVRERWRRGGREPLVIEWGGRSISRRYSRLYSSRCYCKKKRIKG